MTDSKEKEIIDIADSEKNGEATKESAAAGITVSGISGTKTLRVGRVNKKPRPERENESETVLTSEVTNSAAPSSKEVVQSKTTTAEEKDNTKKKTDNSDSKDKMQGKDVATSSSDALKKETEKTVNNETKAPIESVTKENDPKVVEAINKEQGDVAVANQKQNAESNKTTEPARRPNERDIRPNGYDNRSSDQAARSGDYQSRDTRPQNSSGYNNRSTGQGGYNNRPSGQAGYNNNRPAGQGGYSNDRPGGYNNNRPAGQGGYNNNRPAGQGGYSSDRPGGYNNNRPAGQGGYNNNRPTGQGGYNNNRPAGPGGYNNNRPAGQGGYQGNRPPNSRPGGSGGNFRPRESGFPQGKDDNYIRSKDDNGHGSKNSGRSASKPHSDLPAELSKEKANFAARSAFDKTRKDTGKDTKKDSKSPIVQNDRRGNNIKAATAAFSGRGASEILSDDAVLDTFYSGAVKGKKGQRRKGPAVPAAQPVRAVLSHVQIPPFLTVKDFSEGIQKRSADVIKKLMKLGVLATINQEIDFDTATLIAAEFGITTEPIVEVTEEDILFDEGEDQAESLQVRPPVVVVMGHVDHGKTSLLDRIRSASVVKGEAGGITQHIGAYTVRLRNGRKITFLDTPGHEAFTTMRARGAQVTDIAILVVAADDGVMPQTIEAINHAKAANTEIVVAINKMDKSGANPDRVKQELSQHGIIPEEWGGTNIIVPVSAKTGDGIEDLLEMVLLTADIMDLKADPHRQAKGTVIEAKLDKNRGPVATVLVQRGTLRSGDTIVTGSIIGRIRAMADDKGASVKKAGPSIPVEILGLPEVPDAGELFYAVTDEKVARQLAEKRRVKQREDQLRKSSRMSLETLAQTLAAGEVKDLNLIVKADVQGSVEAVTQSLEKLSNDEVRVKVIHGAVGTVTDTDITLADVSNAIIIGFNVRPSIQISEKAKDLGVDIKLYRVIYSAIEDIEAAMKGLLKPTFEEVVLGHIEIRQIFKVSNVGTIGGAYVTDGKVLRSSEVRVVRDGIVIHEGKLASLKRFKDDAKEVATGYECGISIENFNDIKEGDVIEAFEMREIARK